MYHNFFYNHLHFTKYCDTLGSVIVARNYSTVVVPLLILEYFIKSQSIFFKMISYSQLIVKPAVDKNGCDYKLVQMIIFCQTESSNSHI